MDKKKYNYTMDQNNSLYTIKKMFLSFTPLAKLKDFINKCDIKFNNDTQRNILDNTVNNCLTKKYPLKMSYQKLFLKYLLQQLESQGEEIIDELYNTYCNMLTVQDESNETHYRHFILDRENESCNITIQESINMISQGTTGLCSWEAAFVLSEWCIENKSMLDGKIILELGSGIGLLGLSVIKMCSPKQYIFTDGHEKVVSMLCDNVLTNFTNDDIIMHNNKETNKSNLHLSYKNSDIMVKQLLWEDIDKWICETNIKPDIILAADILFDYNVFSHLVNGLKLLLTTHGSLGYIAATIRNETTFNKFLNLLDKYNISYQDEVVSKQKIFVHTEHTTIRVIKIS